MNYSGREIECFAPRATILDRDAQGRAAEPHT